MTGYDEDTARINRARSVVAQVVALGRGVDYGVDHGWFAEMVCKVTTNTINRPHVNKQ